jgi:hypothetical protein
MQQATTSQPILGVFFQKKRTTVPMLIVCDENLKKLFQRAEMAGEAIDRMKGQKWLCTTNESGKVIGLLIQMYRWFNSRSK